MDLTLVNSSTIGIQNAGGTIALQVVYENDYVHNNLAVLLTTDILPWASASPTSGVVGPGDSTEVELRIHPSGLRMDTLYTGGLRISGNTPDVGVIHLALQTSNPVGVGEGGGIPAAFVLSQNYPNPFNPATTIRYGLPHASHVTLVVFNTLGQQVASLVSEEQQAGFHEVRFENPGIASGVYFYRIQAGDFVATRKLLMLK